MSLEHSDIIEVFLKKELDIFLTEEEENLFNIIDDDTRKTIFELLNSNSFIEEIINVVNNLKIKISKLPIEEQTIINQKCEEKIKKLLNKENNYPKIR